MPKGYYKRVHACLHYTDHTGFEWYAELAWLDVASTRTLLSGRSQYVPQSRVTNLWIGSPAERSHPSNRHFDDFYKALSTFKHKWRLHRARQRIAAYKEELMSAAWHPNRVAKWIAQDRWDLLE